MRLLRFPVLMQKDVPFIMGDEAAIPSASGGESLQKVKGNEMITIVKFQ